ncbi:MAG: hypothetical protein IKN04_23095 [Clostridia bacterium]|nr:hypothetical protein [Clostridia bacterium]
MEVPAFPSRAIVCCKLIKRLLQFFAKRNLRGERQSHKAEAITCTKAEMQMLKADTSVKDSLAGKRQRCAWSFPYALTVVKNSSFGQWYTTAQSCLKTGMSVKHRQQEIQRSS